MPVSTLICMPVVAAENPLSGTMLDINIWNFIWSAVNIIILFVLLKIFLFKPINKLMDDRTQSIRNDIDSAEKAKKEAEELRQHYENSLGEAKEEAKKIIMKAHDEAEIERTANLHFSPQILGRELHSAHKTLLTGIPSFSR